MASTGVLLFLSSCATAVIHALIPDHWLPFVLMARAQRWSDRRTVLMVGLAGLIHVFVSLAVSAVAIGIGTNPARSLAGRLGASLESLVGLLLILFGLTYGIGAHLREARAHARSASPAGGPPPMHGHGHLLGRWLRGAASGPALAVIVGVSPCMLLQPILFGAAARGTAVVAAAAIGFALCTLGTMIGVTAVAIRGMRRIELPFFTRFGDLVSGLLIAGIGLFVFFQEL